MNKLTCIIIDDESLAQERVQRFLTDYSDITLLGCADSGTSGLEMISKHNPDLIFLDIQMPEMTGLQMLQHMSEVTDNLPQIIFTTAFDEYALQAFELHAIDYLLKPFSKERFNIAVDHVLNLQQNSAAEVKKFNALVSQLKSGSETKKYQQRIAIRDGGRISFVETEDIIWIESDGNYVEIHTADKTHLMRETLTKLESSISPKKFYRISRSAIVNVSVIKDVVSNGKGEVFVNTLNGNTLKSTHTMKELQARMEG